MIPTHCPVCGAKVPSKARYCSPEHKREARNSRERGKRLEAIKVKLLEHWPRCANIDVAGKLIGVRPGTARTAAYALMRDQAEKIH